MKPPEVRKYLLDITAAIALLRSFTSGKSLADYKTDALLRSGVERQFEIIGEALVQAGRRDSALASEITFFPQIVAFRNRLIHAYAAVDDDIVWGVLQEFLPTLELEVSRLLD